MENREKYLSFVVPCYNSESYMARCIESLLPGGEDVEIHWKILRVHRRQR